VSVGRLLVDLAKLNVDSRWVDINSKVTEAQLSGLVEAMTGALEVLPPAQRDAVRVALAAELRRRGGQVSPSAPSPARVAAQPVRREPAAARSLPPAPPDHDVGHGIEVAEIRPPSRTTKPPDSDGIWWFPAEPPSAKPEPLEERLTPDPLSEPAGGSERPTAPDL
jgi:hypothetical protein